MTDKGSLRNEADFSGRPVQAARIEIPRVLPIPGFSKERICLLKRGREKHVL